MLDHKPGNTSIAILAAAAGISIGFFVVDGRTGVLAFALALIVASSLSLEVELPWGGSVPLGHAVVIALTELLSGPRFALVAILGLIVYGLIQRHRHGVVRIVATVTLLATSALAAVAVHALIAAIIRVYVHADFNRPFLVLPRVLVAGVAYLIVDFVGRNRLGTSDEHGHLRDALPIHVTLLCAAALLAIAERKLGPASALLAAIPLFVTRYSFQRYFDARKTYEQTIKALSILPEIASLAPIGHGERTAVYATALAEAVGFDAEETDHVSTAARLHHIGYIFNESADQETTTSSEELGKLSAQVLRETGVLAGVAELVAEVRAGDSRDIGTQAAIVRVASMFDHLVGEDPAKAENAVVQLQTHHPRGIERRMAIELARVYDRNPELAERARLAAEPLTSAAAEIGPQ